MRRNVARWVRQSSRLWIWIRSSTGHCSSSADRRICAVPASRPLVQTFVARKTRGRRPASATRSPVAASARPYIGEVSIMRPPASASTRSTAASFSRAGSPGPISNTCQVPSPITGIASPLDGIGRVIIVPAPAAISPPLLSKIAPAAPAIVPRTSRRRIGLPAPLPFASGLFEKTVGVSGHQLGTRLRLYVPGQEVADRLRKLAFRMRIIGGVHQHILAEEARDSVIHVGPLVALY